jgi:hypothetical protein
LMSAAGAEENGGPREYVAALGQLRSALRTRVGG